MSAVISVVQKYGLSEYISKEIAKLEFYFLPIEDATQAPEDFPIRIPETGVEYSYEVWLCFRCDTAPSQYCKNFKIWGDGNSLDGMKITINTSTIWDWQPPVNTKSNAGTRDDFANYTSSNKLPIAGELKKVGDKTSWMVFQLEVYPQAEQGSYSDFTVYYQYDEV